MEARAGEHFNRLIQILSHRSLRGARAASMVALALVLSLASGCSGAKKKPDGAEGANSPAVGFSPPSAGGDGEIYGPPMPAPVDTYGPEKVQVKRAVLVFGAGMAEGFAHAGVLRALKEAKIPVGAVLGTEMGSLIAAIYATDENVNRLEWALLRFDDEAFSGGGLLGGLFKGPRSGKKLESELRREFLKKDIAHARIPLRVMFEAEGSTEPMVLSKGELVDALRGALADPKLLEPGEWQGARVHSAQSGIKGLLREARALGSGPVIYVHTQGTPVPEGLDADLVIQPDLKDIQRTDFKKRAAAIARGRSSARAQLDTIRSLTGAAPKAPAGVTQ